MPLTINVGLSRKASENYQSQGVSINLSAELDQSLLADPRRLQREITGLYEQAEIAIHQQASNGVTQTSHAKSRNRTRNQNNGHEQLTSTGQSGNGHRPATRSQIRALHAIADRLQIDLDDECTHEFGCDVRDLDIRQASQFIDDLKQRQESARASNGARR
jgi:hypothetical protein